MPKQTVQKRWKVRTLGVLTRTNNACIILQKLINLKSTRVRCDSIVDSTRRSRAKLISISKHWVHTQTDNVDGVHLPGTYTDGMGTIKHIGERSTAGPITMVSVSNGYKLLWWPVQLTFAWSSRKRRGCNVVSIQATIMKQGFQVRWDGVEDAQYFIYGIPRSADIDNASYTLIFNFQSHPAGSACGSEGKTIKLKSTSHRAPQIV